MLLKESFESFVSIFIGIGSMANIVIVRSSVLVGEDIISFTDIVELGFSLFSIGLMLIWMAISRELFVGLVDFCGGGIRLEP